MRSQSTIAATHSRSGNGKVARLPKPVRDQINNSILDGVPYPVIINQLGDLGKDLTAHNLSEYRKFSYQTWLREKNWRDDLHARQESFTDLLQGKDATQLPEVALQITATQMCELLHDLNPLAVRSEIESDPDKYVRLLNALARVSRVLIGLQQYRDARAKEQTELKQLDSNRDLDKEHDLLIAAMERGFGLKAAPGPIAPAFYDRFDTPAPTVPSQDPSNTSAERVSPDSQQLSQSQVDAATTSNSSEPSDLPAPSLVEDAQLATLLIENQNSKIENSHDSHSSPTSHSSENPITPSLHDSSTPVASSIQNQNSKLENPLCHVCDVPLPARLLNDPRPYRACPACNTQLPPHGSRFDNCQFCGALQPIFSNNQRTKDYCHRCGITLPPPGQRFVENCPKCGIELPMITKDGVRLWNICSECHAPLPLLEPVPPETNALRNHFTEKGLPTGPSSSPAGQASRAPPELASPGSTELGYLSGLK
jgi:hypothetical protein